MQNKNEIISIISEEEFQNVLSKIDSMNAEELIQNHKKLIGKTSTLDGRKIDDCGVEFIEKVLTRDRGRSLVYHYSEELQKFIYSKYLSEYFKENIVKLLGSRILDEKVYSALINDKNINNLREEEIKTIYSALRDFYKKSLYGLSYPKYENVGKNFMLLLSKLNGSGVVSFIKNNIPNIEVAESILDTSGIVPEPSYYSREVHSAAVNEEHLEAIFNKLFEIDINYAVQFVEMVKQIEKISASEFICEFFRLASNNFRTNIKPKEEVRNFDDLIQRISKIHEKKKQSLDTSREEKQIKQFLRSQLSKALPFLSEVESIEAIEKEVSQIRLSEQIKKAFLLKISSTLQLIDPNYDWENTQVKPDNNAKCMLIMDYHQRKRISTIKTEN